MKIIELPRTTVRLPGADRVAFLQNFCTADIKLLNVGDVCEAFVLGTKGKLVGHVLVFFDQSFIELNTVPGQGQTLIQHLDRYLIREDVELSEVELNHAFFFGEAESSASLDVPSNRFELIDSVRVASCEAAGNGLLLSCEDLEQLTTFISKQEPKSATDSELAFHRVSCGTPWFGVDSTTDTLPQELQRDEKAISFTKGCYLGQETVARIDALGRVNKLLVRLESDQPFQVGDDLNLGEKKVGVVSSSASRGDKHLGLAIVRREAASSGTQLHSNSGDISVVF